MNEQAKHTPGPWFEYGGSIYGHGDTPGDTYIAEMAYGDGMNETSKEQALINARLIAAAPDLIEALREIIDHGIMDAPGICSGCDKARGLADAAIAKATGAQP